VPRTLEPITLGEAIVDKAGAISIGFRQKWQQLMDSFQFSPSVAAVELVNQSAAVVTTSAYLTKAAGLYRISYVLRKTVADGVSSSLTFTYGWIESGVALTESAAALATDTTTAQQSGTKLVYADANTDLTFALAYASNTPAAMHYRVDVTVEQIG
jgi:hypothetical protein